MANDSYFDKIRMGNIYGTANPWAGTISSHPPILDTFMNEIVPAMQSEDQRRMRLAQLFGPQPGIKDLSTNRGRDVLKPMDTVYQPTIGDQIQQRNIAEEVHPSPEIEIQKAALGQKASMQEAELQRKQQETDIHQQRANVYQFKASNPNSKLMLGKDGTLRAINPVTNEVTELGKTGMSDAEVAELNQKNAMARIEGTGEQARETEKTRQTGRENLEDMKARHAKELKELESGAPPRTADLPSQQRVATMNRANEAFNAHPEWRKHIKLTDNGFTIAAPGGMFGPSQDTYDEIKNFIYSGGGKKAETKPTAPTKPAGKSDPLGLRK